MKFYISVDIEGIAGISVWDEATRWKPDYPPFRDELMKEIQAACEGLNAIGAKEIWIKDAHGVGRNIIFDGLPDNVRLIRSISGHPYNMMEGIDETFDAALMIGYHSYGGSDRNPLAHTLETDLASIKINDQFASEFLINTYTAALVNVPVIFVSGDVGICEHIKSINEKITTVGISEGVGGAVYSYHPNIAYQLIKDKVQEAVKTNLGDCILPLPDRFKVEVSFINHIQAYKASFYPGVKKISPTTIVYESDDYFEVLRMLLFVI